MQFKPVHINFNVKDLDKSIAFYEEALGLHEKRRRKRCHREEWFRDAATAGLCQLGGLDRTRTIE